MSGGYDGEVIDLTGSGPVTRKCYFPPECIIDLGNDSIIYVDVDEPSNASDKKKQSKEKRSATTEEEDSTRLTDESSDKESNDGESFAFGNCPICWDKLGTNPLASTKCGHVFCLECLKTSLKAEKSCPTCRRVLRGATAYHPLYLGPN